MAQVCLAKMQLPQKQAAFTQFGAFVLHYEENIDCVHRPFSIATVLLPFHSFTLISL
jgi:hypothetical protein